MARRVRVELDAHRVLLRAEDLHLGHAADRGDALRQDGLGVLVHRVQRQRRRAQRQIQDRLVGRVHLLVRGRRRHARRQLGRGGGDGRLHVLGGGVDVALEAELHGDLGEAERARRRHRVDARDGRELPLERRRHRRRHGVGARAGQARRDLDGGEVHVGQVAHRQQAIGDDAEDEDARHDQRGHDGPPDEELGAHALTSTRAPGTSRSWPSVTTRSPAERPLVITVSRPSISPGVTGRDSTVRSGLTTKTYGPCCPVWMACDGTTRASVSVVSVRTTSANWPGQSALSVLSKVALSWIVPVAVSTVLLTKDRSPRTGRGTAPDGTASTRRAPIAR